MLMIIVLLILTQKYKHLEESFKKKKSIDILTYQLILFHMIIYFYTVEIIIEIFI